MTSVCLFRCFKEDHRISMDLYADELYKQLELNFSHLFCFKQFLPKISGVISFLPDWGQIKMRAARMAGYPIQIMGQLNDICHIVDHGYSNLLYFMWRKKTVVTVHDLMPLLAWRGRIKGLSYPHLPLLNYLSFFALNYADAIIADSQSTKNDLINELGINPENIAVVYCGVSEKFKPITIQARNKIRSHFGFANTGIHYVLISGSQSYKNHSTAIKVVVKSQLKTKSPIQIVRLGSAFDEELKKTLEQNDLFLPLISISDLDEWDVVKLYQSMDCLLFPSFYEGFGLPPLEAMACGVPVVASNAASLPEVIGDAGVLANPDDIDRLSEGLCSLLEDQKVREKYILLGLERAKKFNWQKTAIKTIEVYQKVLESS